MVCGAENESPATAGNCMIHQLADAVEVVSNDAGTSRGDEIDQHGLDRWRKKQCTGGEMNCIARNRNVSFIGIDGISGKNIL